MNIKNTLTDALQEVSSLRDDVKEVAVLRRELLKVEAEEYAGYVKKKVVAVGALMMAAFFFLCVLIVATIGWVGTLLKTVLPESMHPYSWQIVATLVSLFFLGATLILLRRVQQKPTDRFFSLSLKELQNDSEWLKTLSKKENNS